VWLLILAVIVALGILGLVLWPIRVRLREWTASLFRPLAKSLRPKPATPAVSEDANVLKGDMSLVGPRPEQVELVERYTREERIRLAVKPGMTGPMQVFGRGQLTFEERLALERDYVENLSLARDLRILALTLPAVIAGDGAF
jgi:hypothetical protein